MDKVRGNTSKNVFVFLKITSFGSMCTNGNNTSPGSYYSQGSLLWIPLPDFFFWSASWSWFKVNHKTEKTCLTFSRRAFLQTSLETIMMPLFPPLFCLPIVWILDSMEMGQGMQMMGKQKIMLEVALITILQFLQAVANPKLPPNCFV